MGSSDRSQLGSALSILEAAAALLLELDLGDATQGLSAVRSGAARRVAEKLREVSDDLRRETTRLGMKSRPAP